MSSQSRRKAIRFVASEAQISKAALDADSKGAMYLNLVDSSTSGLSALLRRADFEKIDETIFVFNEGDPRRAVLRWSKSLDEIVVHAGFEFLDS